MRRWSRRAVLGGAATVAAVGTVGCAGVRRDVGGTDRRGATTDETGTETTGDATRVGDAPAVTPDSVTVGAKNFAENRILGRMAAITLRERTDRRVQTAIPSGYDEPNWIALTEGRLDCYWEYTGTIYLSFEPTHESAPDDPAALYDAVVEEAAEQGVTVFPRAPFDNTFVMLAGADWRERTGVETLSDFAAYVNAGNTDVDVAVGNDFLDRPDGWPGLVDHYEFDEAALTALDDEISAVPLGITYELYERGDADVVMGFNTDPQIHRTDLAVLTDDRDFFPTYNPIPVADVGVVGPNTRAGERLAELGPAFDGVETIRRLNGRVVVDGDDPATVAREFLENEGLL
ncbi:glycine betaine ABC transporter substrate-binding protein [Halobaculum sp. MBLA0147]|uniref:glycine betaine ABC transporter substrate-binding protein n=1 Tax=Halobaculum sp. MBLA0147 TaxID=3079934 RepID=UPI0035262F7E